MKRATTIILTLVFCYSVIGQTARPKIPDLWVVDQNGKKVRFYSDLIKGKVVLVHAFFTQCSVVCPMQARSLVKLKNSLGERLGRDVFLISISKDPRHDTPEKLSEWGKEYGVGDGWTLLTGEESDIQRVLRDVVTEDIGKEMHESLVLIGNDRTGVWTTTYGLRSTHNIVKVIDDVSRSQ